ncbi:ankyrin repeat domain-containing protein, partial [archaeon]
LLQLGDDNRTGVGADGKGGGLRERGYVNLPTSPTHSTPLMLAAERNHLNIIMLLLKHGAAQGAAMLDAHGNNCLHYAARGDASLTLVKVLLMCGAPNVRNHAGQLPGEICRSKLNFNASAAISAHCKLSGGGGGSGGVSGTLDERINFLYRYEVLGEISEDIKQGEEEGKENQDENQEDEEGGAALQQFMGRNASVKVNRMWGMLRPVSAPPTTSTKSAIVSSVQSGVGRQVNAGKKKGLIQKSFVANSSNKKHK